MIAERKPKATKFKVIRGKDGWDEDIRKASSVCNASGNLYAFHWHCVWNGDGSRV